MLRKLLLTLLLVALALVAAACSASNNTNHNNDVNSEHNHTEENAEHEHDEDAEMVPNNGAIITLLSPADGATFTTDDEIKVEVEVENFSLGQDGNHWHINVGDTEYAMVVGENTSDVIRGLEPGEYTITVRLANGDHQDLEEGDTATITITE